MEPRRQRNARSRPDTKAELQFVTVVPAGQDEKAETRAIIRANAAHFHWRNNRPPRDKYTPKRSSLQARSPTECMKRGLVSAPPSSRAAISSWVIDRAAANGIDQFQSSTPRLIEHGAGCDHDEINSCTLRPLANAQLGLEVVDPFSSYASDLPTDLVSRCIAYNARVVLPALFPDAADTFNIRANMLQLSIAHASMLHMFIMGALIHSQGALGLTPGSSITLDVFRSRAEIVRHVNIAMRDPVQACTDINVLAVSALANNGLFENVEVPLKTPKQGPLRELQLLSSFGMTESVLVHVDGLSKLIEYKGGLGKISMPGLAALISFTGLRVGTRNLAEPRYPLVTLSCPLEAFRFQHQGVGFGVGFGTEQDLYEVLAMLNSYTIMIDDFCEGRKVVTACVLIDHRNTTQHALLSLPPRVGNSECCRLAALIYSLLVTFPLPYIVAPFQRLVRQLKTALTKWDGGDQVLIWVLTMGGIGAIGLGERKWFVKRFRAVATRMGVRSWDEAREVLKRGLWFGATNDGDGSDFWLEIQSV